jgi:probable rRNA maturation factor
MSITYVSEGVKKPKLRFNMISKWLKQVIAKFGYITGDLTFIFCDDDYLKGINLKYLNHDFYTDIVTFDYKTNDPVVTGDMFISIDRVKENSEFYKCDINDEYLRVIVHGILHLLGFNDSTEVEKSIMRSTENECIFMFKEISNGNIE